MQAQAPGQLSSTIIALGGNPTNLQAKDRSRCGRCHRNIQDTQAIQGAQNNIYSITSFIQTNSLNPSALNIANATIQEIQNNMSNPN